MLNTVQFGNLRVKHLKNPDEYAFVSRNSFRHYKDDTAVPRLCHIQPEQDTKYNNFIKTITSKQGILSLKNIFIGLQAISAKVAIYQVSLNGDVANFIRNEDSKNIEYFPSLLKKGLPKRPWRWFIPSRKINFDDLVLDNRLTVFQYDKTNNSFKCVDPADDQTGYTKKQYPIRIFKNGDTLNIEQPQTQETD